MHMYQNIEKNWEKTKYFSGFSLIIIFLLLLAVVYKSDEKV